MGFFSKIFGIFDGHVETRDNHSDVSLRTHYYKAIKDKVMNQLEDIINKNPNFSLMDISKDRGEVAATTVKGKQGLLVITIVTVGPFKTSVDLTFTVDRGLLGSFGTQLFQQVYSELDSQFTQVKP